jgi:phosphopantothenoylcysteine decarboxylase/phosphopantothenate--cysteine ligase
VSDRPPQIILGVTGCVGAFKAVLLLRLMRKAGWQVRTVMTESGKEFIGEATFHALSGHPVVKDAWDLEASQSGEIHVELTDWADAVVVYPATANLLAGVAAGLSDDLLRLTLLCFDGPKLLCPAMHTRMNDNPLHRGVVDRLHLAGVHILPSVTGELASGELGAGRLPEPEDAFIALQALLTPADLRGKKLLVTAGPTRERIDPVRFLSNASTGRMGYAVAEAALRRGAEVVLISGPCSLRPPAGAHLIAVETAAEMAEAVHTELDSSNVVVMTAAVSDYRPIAPAAHKLKKDGGPITIDLEPTEDILGGLRARGFTGFLVGFAMETEDLIPRAKGKLERKGLNLIVANDLNVEGAGFAVPTNVVTFIHDSGQSEALPKLSKEEVATKLLDRIAARLA